MKVHSFYSEGKMVRNSRKNSFEKCEVSEEAKMKLRRGILNNCSAIIEMDDKDYVPIGNGTEVGLLRFLQDADVPIHLEIMQKLGHIVAVSPFTSNKKRSAIAIRNKENNIEIHVKGAPETMLSICRNKYTEEGVQPMSEDQAKIYEENVD